MKKIVLALIMVLIMTTPVFAQAESVVVPTDKFRYSLKRFGENIGMFFRFTHEKKVEYGLKLAQNRLDELESLPVQYREQYQNYLMSSYQKHMSEAEMRAEQSASKEMLKSMIQSRLQQHIQQMTAFQATSSGEQQNKLELIIQQMEATKTKLQNN